MVISRLKKPEHSSTLHMLVRLVLGLIEITSINLADIVIENGFPRGKQTNMMQTIITDCFSTCVTFLMAFYLMKQEKPHELNFLMRFNICFPVVTDGSLWQSRANIL